MHAQRSGQAGRARCQSPRLLGALLAAAVAAACMTHPVGDPPSLVAIIAAAAPAVVAIGDERSVFGSGFRLGRTQLIATAAHVVKSLQGIPDVRSNGQHWAARVVVVDEAADVAVLEVEGSLPIPGLKLAPTHARVEPGEWIVVLGCPFGAGATATTGIVSAMPGAIVEPAVLQGRVQLNAAVNPGNSGGPVLNLKGEVIGIANAAIPGGFGLGFATSAAAIRAALAHAGRSF